MTNFSANDSGEQLLETIKSKDFLSTLEKIKEFNAMMHDVTVGATYVLYILEPKNLARLHNGLINDLDISPRALKIKRSLMSRTQKAVLLIQAMEIAIKRAYNII